MENAVEKLTQKITWHESEARRLRAALEVFREMEGDGAAASFANSTFAEALRIILKAGPKKTAQIRRALQDGGFKPGNKNYRVMVANRLADAARRKQVVKNGKGGKGLTWSLPTSSSP